MPELTINGTRVDVPAGTTLLAAAKRLGANVPTLCHIDGLPPYTSCMVCVVEERRSGRLIPSCTALAEDGMDIVTDNERVHQSRRDALEFLLSEHIGDCEAPCRRVCPAHMDIPRMIGHITRGELRAAIITVKTHIALPAILGRICPAPCEKGCRRGRVDAPVGICLLKRFVADADLASPHPWLPECAPDTGRRVAIVGAGPAGLAAAYHLREWGHACALYDRHIKPGGMLRYGIPEERLPHAVLEAEIDIIRRLGAELHPGVLVGDTLPFDELIATHDAVILATGSMPRDADTAANTANVALPDGVEYSETGIHTVGDTLQTTRPGVFAAGDVTRESRLTVRSVAQGRLCADAVHRYLSGLPVAAPPARTDSRIGHLDATALTELMRGTDPARHVAPATPAKGYTTDEAVAESRRCMHCECLKSEDCRLRELADRYRANARRFPHPADTPAQVVRRLDHPDIVFEPGKCIRCGICIRITAAAAEQPGMAFLGRGYDMTVDTPFGAPLIDALDQTAALCIGACPTGALAWKRNGTEASRNERRK